MSVKHQYLPRLGLGVEGFVLAQAHPRTQASPVLLIEGLQGGQFTSQCIRSLRVARCRHPGLQIHWRRCLLTKLQLGYLGRRPPEPLSERLAVETGAPPQLA